MSRASHEPKFGEGTSRAYADRIEVLQALAASDAREKVKLRHGASINMNQEKRCACVGK